MSIKDARITDYIWWIKRQYPMGITTWGACANRCGMTARGGSRCAECLTAELGEIVGEELANEFNTSIRRQRDLEHAVLEAADQAHEKARGDL